MSAPRVGAVTGYGERLAREAAAVAEDHCKHLLSPSTCLELPIFAWQLSDGTALAKFSDGASATPGYSLDNSKALGIRWNNNGTTTPIGTTVPIPSDLDDSKDVVLHIMAAKSGATAADAVTFTCAAFFQSVAALQDADTDAGGASSAMTGAAAAKTVQHVTLTIAAANVAAAPATMTLTVVPTAAKLTTDDVTIHRMWIEYTPKYLTDG